MKKLIFKTMLLSGALLASCSDDIMEAPVQEDYAKSFVELFGPVHPDQDWNMAAQKSVTVNPGSANEVKIYADNGNGYQLAGHFTNVSGTQTFKFDALEKADKFIVVVGSMSKEVENGGTVDFSAISRSYLNGDYKINDTTNLYTKLENYRTFSKDYLVQYLEKQPEGKDRRTQTKSVLLGIMYSRGARAIAEQFGRNAQWGQELIDNFYKSFPSIKEIIIKSQYQAEKLGFVCTITGRKRRLPNMKLPKDNYLYQEASRQCLNARIQGSSADVMKLAMVNLWNHPRFKELGCKILMTIHDEMVIECKDEHMVEVAELLPEVMKDTAMKLLGTKQKCDVEVSKVWSGDDVYEQIKEKYSV
jgi:hypothetical protein